MLNKTQRKEHKNLPMTDRLTDQMKNRADDRAIGRPIKQTSERTKERSTDRPITNEGRTTERRNKQVN